MGDKDISLTMDSKVLVKQILSTLPQMGNQINIINVQSVTQGGNGEIKEGMFCFDLEFEKFFEMLPSPRLRSLIDFCYQLAMKKFNGNAFQVGRYVGVTERTIYKFLEKNNWINQKTLKEITE